MQAEKELEKSKPQENIQQQSVSHTTVSLIVISSCITFE